MLFLALAGFILTFATLFFARYFVLKARGVISDYDVVGNHLIVISLIIVTFGFAVYGGAWAKQISDFEDIKKFQKVSVIYQTKADALTTEFAKYLAENYPEHEKDIYAKIRPDNIVAYFAKYPEVRTSDTLVELVNRINKLQSDVYD